MNYFKFLGTAATCPSLSRNTSSIYFKIENLQFIVDCGENTQRQMLKFEENIDLDFIIITHMHGDHFLGLFGLLETYKLYTRTRDLIIYCSDLSLKKFYFEMFKNFIFKLNFIEITEELILNVSESCNIKFQIMDHTIKTYGCYISYLKKAKLNIKKIEQLNLKPGPWCNYILKFKEVIVDNRKIILKDIIQEDEKNTIIFYSSDTKPIDLKIKPTILIHECTYYDNHFESIKNKHTSFLDFISFIKKYELDYCYLTHISQRSDIQLKNQKHDKNIIIAKDGLKHDF